MEDGLSEEEERLSGVLARQGGRFQKEYVCGDKIVKSARSELYRTVYSLFLSAHRNPSK